MDNKKRQTAIAGTILIALGIIWTLNLWWLLLPGALFACGVAAFLQRRAAGRNDEAIHGALWGIGLGLLFLLDFVWPGILFLAGASILLRGREQQVQASLSTALQRVRVRRGANAHTQNVPVDTVTVPSVPLTIESGSTTGETTRLRD